MKKGKGFLEKLGRSSVGGFLKKAAPVAMLSLSGGCGNPYQYKQVNHNPGGAQLCTEATECEVDLNCASQQGCDDAARKSTEICLSKSPSQTPIEFCQEQSIISNSDCLDSFDHKNRCNKIRQAIRRKCLLYLHNQGVCIKEAPQNFQYKCEMSLCQLRKK